MNRNLDLSRTAGPELTRLASAVDEKVEATRAWVQATYGDQYDALFMLDAEAWKNFPPHIQALGGAAMAEVLADTYPPYGQGYPLPEFIGPEYNTKVIASGAVLPYFGFVAPKGLTAAKVYEKPDLLAEHWQALRPVAVSARVVGDDGSQELGRSAKIYGDRARGFRAGALILQSQVDWLAHPESTPSHVVRAEVRAADEHLSANGRLIASSMPTQTEYFNRLGLRPTRFLPAYVVGGALEPFVIGELPRTNTWEAHLHDFPIYTPPGRHVAFLQTLGNYQVGQPLPLVETRPDGVPSYQFCATPAVHGNTVYAKVEPLAKGNQHLTDTLDQLHETVPMVMVKVPAHTPGGAATQQILLDRGFIVCGFEPAHESPGKNPGERSVVPPVVCMARPGKSVLTGKVPLARACFPHQAYGHELQQAFHSVDAQFRNAIAEQREKGA